MSNLIRQAPWFFLYRRHDGYVGIINAGTEKSVETLLNVLPEPYKILGKVSSLVEAKERIRDGRYDGL